MSLSSLCMFPVEFAFLAAPVSIPMVSRSRILFLCRYMSSYSSSVSLVVSSRRPLPPPLTMSMVVLMVGIVEAGRILIKQKQSVACILVMSVLSSGGDHHVVTRITKNKNPSLLGQWTAAVASDGNDSYR